jgi:hypothetical protein
MPRHPSVRRGRLLLAASGASLVALGAGAGAATAAPPQALKANLLGGAVTISVPLSQGGGTPPDVIAVDALGGGIQLRISIQGLSGIVGGTLATVDGLLPKISISLPKLLPIDLGLLLSTNTAAHVDALGSDVEVNGEG